MGVVYDDTSGGGEATPNNPLAPSAQVPQYQSNSGADNAPAVEPGQSRTFKRSGRIVYDDQPGFFERLAIQPHNADEAAQLAAIRTGTYKPTGSIQNPLPTLAEAGQRMASGFGQIGAEAQGYGPEYTAGENARRAAVEAAHPGMGERANRVAMAGNVGAALATGGMGLSGFWSNILAQTGLGAAQAGTQFSPTGENAKNAAVGAAISAPLAVAAGSAPTIANVLRRKIGSLLQDGNVSAANAAIREVAPNVADNMTLAQMTGSPWMAANERTMASTNLLDKYASQANGLAGDMSVALRQMPDGAAAGPAALEGGFLGARQKAEGALRSMAQNRNEAWTAGMKAFEDQTASLGKMETPRLSSAVENLQADALDIIKNPGGYKIGGDARKALDDIRTSIAPTPDPRYKEIETQIAKLTSQGMPANVVSQVKQRLLDEAGLAAAPAETSGQLISKAGDRLTGLRALQEDADPRVQAIGNKLRDAFQEDLEAALPQHPALGILRDTRAEYARQSALLQASKNAASAKLLGVGQGIADASELPSGGAMWRGYKALPDDQRQAVTAWLKSNNPELLPHLKDSLIREALQESSSGLPVGGVRAARVQIPRLDAAVENMQRYNDLWSPSEQRALSGLRTAAQSLRYTNMPQVSPGMQGSAADKAASMAYAGVGMLHGSVALGTKFLMKAAGQYGAFQDILMNPNTQSLLTMANTSGPGQAAARAGLMAYLDHAADQYQGRQR